MSFRLVCCSLCKLRVARQHEGMKAAMACGPHIECLKSLPGCTPLCAEQMLVQTSGASTAKCDQAPHAAQQRCSPSNHSCAS